MKEGAIRTQVKQYGSNGPSPCPNKPPPPRNPPKRLELEADTIEFDLGQNDILAVHSAHILSNQQRERVQSMMDAALAKEGRVALIFEHGFTYSILRRP